jgi:hypothetical protein
MATWDAANGISTTRWRSIEVSTSLATTPIGPRAAAGGGGSDCAANAGCADSN